ncbi:MAG TPA: ABC transporter substrate-binding protein [Devosiaceae bacterium]|nr:ABC transporter substrate-binding protein [Devosiaceae bacterium]
MGVFGRLAAVFVLAAGTFAGVANAEPLRIVVGVQQTGTVQWELAAMHNLGIDKKHNIVIEQRQLAGNQAGEIALQTGTVDTILSDFVWVSLQREQGNMVTMVPHSLAVGGLMVDPASGIKSVADLKGVTLASAGTPVDKSWVVLQAYYNKETGGSLAKDASLRFGAPPLVNQLLVGGKVKAALNNWNWNVQSELAGMTQLVSVQEMLKAMGVEETPPLLGWVFTDADAKAKHDAITAFLDASFDTKHALISDDAAWNGIRPLMNVGDNDKLFAAMRDGYRQGVVRSYDPNKMEAAKETFDLLVKFGGKDAVGGASSLADGTFYKGYSK